MKPGLCPEGKRQHKRRFYSVLLEKDVTEIEQYWDIDEELLIKLTLHRCKSLHSYLHG